MLYLHCYSGKLIIGIKWWEKKADLKTFRIQFCFNQLGDLHKRMRGNVVGEGEWNEEEERSRGFQVTDRMIMVKAC